RRHSMKRQTGRQDMYSAGTAFKKASVQMYRNLPSAAVEAGVVRRYEQCPPDRMQLWQIAVQNIISLAGVDDCIELTTADEKRIAFQLGQHGSQLSRAGQLC